MSRFFEEIARAYLVLKGVPFPFPFPFYFDLIVYLQGPPDISINTILTKYNSSSSGIILILTFLYFPRFRVQTR